MNGIKFVRKASKIVWNRLIAFENAEPLFDSIGLISQLIFLFSAFSIDHNALQTVL